jgi:hypothetical protein
MSHPLTRGVLVKSAIVVVLPLLAFVSIVLAISQQMSSHNVEVRGVAIDYEELGRTPVMNRRMRYFPQVAKNIEYWCRPYWNGINGSFDIGETDFLDWAYTMGWEPRVLTPTDLEPSIRIMHADGSDEYIQRPKNCFFYKYQSFKKPNVLCRYFQIVYDRTRGRAYFADWDGHAGPPVEKPKGAERGARKSRKDTM